MIRILRGRGGRPEAGTVIGKSFAAAIVALGVTIAVTAHASADTRSLKLLNLHTREKAEIVFKRNGRYDQDGLRKLNQFLRDWRKNEPTKMDPRLFDLIWEAYKQSGSDDFINVVCGYRSPATNSMLRSRSKGVAQKSQHMLGKAMDFFIPDVKLKKLREIGLKMQGGGVGYYPTSGSPFVHFDVGNVRHWPKMSRKELIALFPNGNTLHVPSDGKPLPGFEQALAAYQSRKKSGDIAIASAGSRSSSSSRSSGGLLAAFFGGGGADDEEDTANVAMADDGEAAPAKPKAAVQPKPTVVAKADTAKPDKQDGKIRILSPDQANRVDLPGVNVEPEPEPVAETIVAALPPRTAPVPDFAPRPQVEVGAAAPAAGPDVLAQPVVEEPAVAVALNVPLPTPRPDLAPPRELASASQDAIALAAAADVTPDPAPVASPPAPAAAAGSPVAAPQALALAAEKKLSDPAAPPADAAKALAAVTAEAMAPLPVEKPVDKQQAMMLAAAVAEPGVPLPSTRPAVPVEDEIAALPQLRPDEEADQGRDDFPVASLPDTVDVAFAASPKEILPTPPSPEQELLSYAANPRNAVVDRSAGAASGKAASPVVKTTAKAARPSRKDVKSTTKKQPVVVTAQPSSARWALDSSYVANNTNNTKAPSYAHNIVRSAPVEVYTAGFQQGPQTADITRFSGKAVTFLTVARFGKD